MYKLGINFDEISDKLDDSIKLMHELDIRYGELRTINSKNFVFWSDKEVANFKKITSKAGINLVAAATPLFKWYKTDQDPDIEHDNFGFDPRLKMDKKLELMERTMVIASMLGITRLRIFSGLGKPGPNAGLDFANDVLLNKALLLADQYKIDLYLENEPVCQVNNKKDIVQLFNACNNPRLKFWLDIANLIEVGDEIDREFLDKIHDRIGYIHIKDYLLIDGIKHYVPVGQGKIDYRKIIMLLHQTCSDDLNISIETHARPDKKIDYSRISIHNISLILKEFQL